MHFSILRSWLWSATVTTVALFSSVVQAVANHQCGGLPSQSDLLSVLTTASPINPAPNVQMWAMIVANDGTLCAEASTSEDPVGTQWLTSRAVVHQEDNKESPFSESGNSVTDKQNRDINAFGDGLSLYDANGKRLGGIVVMSSDTSCSDRTIVQQTRHNLGLDFVRLGLRC